MPNFSCHFYKDERLDVDVIAVPEPTIQISGTDDISREYEDFKLGVRIFADVHILMTTSSSSGGTYAPLQGICLALTFKC